MKDLKLEKFEAAFQENGFDNHEIFPKIRKAQLKEMDFKSGHIMLWEKRYPPVSIYILFVFLKAYTNAYHFFVL